MAQGRWQQRPIAIDLFSGAGGLSLGLRWAGFRVVGAIENDPLAVETFRRHHLETRLWSDDIRNIAVSQVARSLRLRPRELDLLAGCPPCQSFSSIRTLNRGRRVRNRDQKDLLFEFTRFIRGLRPKVIMLENVPGLASDHRLATFRRDLRRLGYKTRFRILNAADYGVPQRRRRVILLGSRFGVPPFAVADGTRRTVRDAIGRLRAPGRTGDSLHDHSEHRSAKILKLIRSIPKDGGSRMELGEEAQLDCHKRVDGFKDVYGRMSWDALAPTITCGFVNPSKGRFLHPRQNRTITLREAATLQSFPRYYRFSMERGKYPAAALIGNALPPEFIRRLAIPVRKYIARLVASSRPVRGKHGR